MRSFRSKSSKRQARVRSALRAKSHGRKRLSVFRSNQHIYAQIIDDNAGHTVVSASTLEKNFKSSEDGGSKKELAAVIGRAIAERAQTAGIREVIFDRGRYLYHGRVRALAEAARESGLLF